MKILHYRSFQVSKELFGRYDNSYLSAKVSMYLHIPIHNVQSDCLDYDMNIFTQKDH